MTGRIVRGFPGAGATALFGGRASFSGTLTPDATIENPLAEDTVQKIYRDRQPTSHMADFMGCVKTRGVPISDVYTHHRAMTICHLANIAIRLDKKIQWDAASEQIVGDPRANSWQSREQRKGYEIKV